MKIICLIGITCLLIVGNDPSYGNYLFNNRDLLVGGKASLLGGAYTALSNDLSGAYYNPSGLVSSSTFTELPLTIYSWKSVERLNATDNVYIRNTATSFSTLPTSLGKIWKISKTTAASIALFKTDDIDFRSFGYGSLYPGGYSTIELSQQSWLAGPSISKQITPNVDVGMSLFLQYSTVRFVGRYDSDIVMANRQNDVWSIGLYPIVGVKWSATNNTTLGMAWSAQTQHLSGHNHAIYQPVDRAPPFRAPIQITEGKGDIRTPDKLSIGIAQNLFSKCTLSVDYIYYFPLDYSFPNEPVRTTEAVNSHKERAHSDVSLGLEWHSQDSIWTVLAGLFTNSSSATSQNLSQKVNSYGLSLGLSKKEKYGTLSGGVVAQYGSSPIQTSDYLQGGDFSEAASWKRTQINFLLGLAIPFDKDSSQVAILR